MWDGVWMNTIFFLSCSAASRPNVRIATSACMCENPGGECRKTIGRGVSWILRSFHRPHTSGPLQWTRGDVGLKALCRRAPRYVVRKSFAAARTYHTCEWVMSHKQVSKKLDMLWEAGPNAGTHMCVYVWIYIYVYIWLSICRYVFTYMCVCVLTYAGMHVRMHVCISVSIYVSAYLYLCISAYVFACMHVCMHVWSFMYVCTYICMYVCTYICRAHANVSAAVGAVDGGGRKHSRWKPCSQPDSRCLSLLMSMRVCVCLSMFLCLCICGQHRRWLPCWFFHCKCLPACTCVCV